MKEIGKQTLDPLTLNSFIPGTLCSSRPLPSQTSATQPAPAAWDSFPVCGKGNSDASSSMPFLDPNKLSAKEMPANPMEPAGSPPLLDHFTPYSVSFSARTTNKLYADCKLRPWHPFFSDPVASPQDLSGCGCSRRAPGTAHGTQPHSCE